ncbi:hydrolase [Streptomyces sulfonofaciens]|uniref:Hydrolase n=1 Tax=Streptomyces sulfonofaciens TaxID=68272 RepID=A0A919FPE4_9ACTN|nr:HAD hydrolase family protein [Streptomyces sulfonofaciens]GHH70010.1 hydrolase [Streptomyces sulfonofaciens]
MRDNTTVTSATARPRNPAHPVRPRLIATDLDGTLLRDDKSVSRRTVAALAAAEQAGIEVFFVTGRPARWMDVVADHVHGHGLAICANGAAVVDLHSGRETAGSTGGAEGTGSTPAGAGTPNTEGASGASGAGNVQGGGGAGSDEGQWFGGHRFIKIRPLARSRALEVVDVLRSAAPGTSFAVELSGGLHHEPTYPPLHLEPGESIAPAEKLLSEHSDVAGQPLLKVLAYHPELAPDDFLALARTEVRERATITRSSPSALLEISGAGVSKASTLALCCEERGISPAEVVAFGDMPNDVDMLTWAGTSYAMGNAHPAVTAAASGRTAGNNDDGVAAVIEQILLNR